MIYCREDELADAVCTLSKVVQTDPLDEPPWDKTQSCHQCPAKADQLLVVCAKPPGIKPEAPGGLAVLGLPFINA